MQLGPGEGARQQAGGSERKQQPQRLTHRDIETLVTQKENAGETADGGADGEPATDRKQHRNGRQSNQREHRRELPIACKDQYLWQAQNTCPDNDHLSNATQRPTP